MRLLGRLPLGTRQLGAGLQRTDYLGGCVDIIAVYLQQWGDPCTRQGTSVARSESAHDRNSHVAPAINYRGCRYRSIGCSPHSCWRKTPC